MADEKAPVVDSEEKFVPKDAYENVKNDMFKFKDEKKKLEDQIKAFKAEKEAQEIDRMKEKEEWKNLYESEAAKRAEIEKARLEEKSKFVNYHKRNAVVAKIGGFKRDEYTNFVDLSKVEMDENGNIVAESLDAEVSRLKQLYPELIKGGSAEVLPAEAPKSFNHDVNKDFSKMTDKEKMDYKFSLLNKK